MARILRGEIRWADLNPTRGREQAGRRLVLILSNDVFNGESPVSLLHTRRGGPGDQLLWRIPLQQSPYVDYLGVPVSFQHSSSATCLQI
jgi:hypothetical protein